MCLSAPGIATEAFTLRALSNLFRLGALLLRRWSQHAPKHPGAAGHILLRV